MLKETVFMAGFMVSSLGTGRNGWQRINQVSVGCLWLSAAGMACRRGLTRGAFINACPCAQGLRNKRRWEV